MKVSVIIPIYNVEPYVEDCLDSVREQTLQDFEMICIHDRGQDRSWDIVKCAAAKDHRIRLFENERNLGLAATRNRGIGLARGEYLYFLDSDDLLRKDALDTLYHRAEERQLEVQAFAASFIYENEELKKKFQSNPARFKQEYPEVVDGPRLFEAWMEVWDWMPSQPRYFYNRSFLEKNRIRFVEGMLHEDEVFAFDVLMYAKRMEVSNDAFFIRRFREGSIMTGTPTVKNVEGCVKILAHLSSMESHYRENPALNRAVKFYMYKIFQDVVRKYKAASDALEKAGENPLIQRLSKETVSEEREMAIYHLIEAFGLWREKD